MRSKVQKDYGFRGATQVDLHARWRVVAVGGNMPNGLSCAARPAGIARALRHRRGAGIGARSGEVNIAGIARDRLERLAAIIRAEYPDDETMAERRIFRAVLPVERGEASLEVILRQEVAG